MSGVSLGVSPSTHSHSHHSPFHSHFRMLGTARQLLRHSRRRTAWTTAGVVTSLTATATAATTTLWLWCADGDGGGDGGGLLSQLSQLSQRLPARTAHGFWYNHSSSTSSTSSSSTANEDTADPGTTPANTTFSSLSPLHHGPTTATTTTTKTHGKPATTLDNAPSFDRRHDSPTPCHDHRCPGRIAQVAQSVLESVVAVRVETGMTGKGGKGGGGGLGGSQLADSFYFTFS